MVAITNGLPRAILNGINDLSTRTPVIEAEQVPQHLPHVFFFAEKGPMEPQLLAGDTLADVYGENTFAYRGEYFTHGTALVNILNGAANAVLAQRVHPEDGLKPAFLRVGVEMVKEKLKQYERNADGTFKTNNGAKIDTGTTVDGVLLRWVVNPTSDATAFGDSVSAVGTLTNAAGEQSTYYPIFDAQVSSPGAKGNNIGMRLWAPTALDDSPIDTAVVEDQIAMLFRLQFVERQSAQYTPVITKSLTGDSYIDFSFRPGAYNKTTDQELYYDLAVTPAYEDAAEDSGFTPLYAPMNTVHIYQDNIELVSKAAYDAESAVTGAPLIAGVSQPEFQMNILTGVAYTGAPYFAVQVATPVDTVPGVAFNSTATYYAQGGSNGTMNNKSFDALVQKQCLNYGDLEYPFLDDARYPQSCIYDSGFSVDTKKAIISVLGKRKDMGVYVGTHIFGEPRLSAAAQSSLGAALRAYARNYPESTLFGTETCRAFIFKQSGLLPNNRELGYFPTTLDIAYKKARYMGASDGFFKSVYRYDRNPNNQMQALVGLDNLYLSVPARNTDWSNGLNWVQSFDRKANFYPMIQSIYADDTSVLKSELTVSIAIELEKVAQRVWRMLTGITGLTQAQFIERSNDLIKKYTDKRFDDLVTITPETFFTAADTARGYSWGCNIHMYAGNAKTVGSFTIVAHRIEETA